jgi:hypothetical protein
MMTSVLVCAIALLLLPHKLGWLDFGLMIVAVAVSALTLWSFDRLNRRRC